MFGRLLARWWMLMLACRRRVMWPRPMLWSRMAMFGRLVMGCLRSVTRFRLVLRGLAIRFRRVLVLLRLGGRWLAVGLARCIGGRLVKGSLMGCCPVIIGPRMRLRLGLSRSGGTTGPPMIRGIGIG